MGEPFNFGIASVSSAITVLTMTFNEHCHNSWWVHSNSVKNTLIDTLSTFFYLLYNGIDSFKEKIIFLSHYNRQAPGDNGHNTEKRGKSAIKRDGEKLMAPKIDVLGHSRIYICFFRTIKHTLIYMYGAPTAARYIFSILSNAPTQLSSFFLPI